MLRRVAQWGLLARVARKSFAWVDFPESWLLLFDWIGLSTLLLALLLPDY